MKGRISTPDSDVDVALYKRLAGSGNRNFVMVAGAGSGKTTSLVKALVHVGRTQGSTLRRNGQQIACITYTDIAAEEIRRDVGDDGLFHASTIHSFLWGVIQPFQGNLREWVNRQLNEKIAKEREKIEKPRTRTATKARAEVNIERFQFQLADIGSIPRFRYGTGSDYSNGILGHSDILKIGPEFIMRYSLMQTVLAQRFPFIFVDESQDTDPSFVEALLQGARTAPESFCLGFFGDPMQKIYMQGVGPIPSENGWETLKKPENFRCPEAVLRVINRIRAEDDQLEQTRGRHIAKDGKLLPVKGSARVLILPADDQRQERLEDVRCWLADQDGDIGWLQEEDGQALRFLVLVHRMAANRLGFPKIYGALNDKSPQDLKSGLIDGTAWVVRPFLSYILPLVLARHEGREFEIMRLLRKHSQLFQPDALVGVDPAQLLSGLNERLVDLTAMLGNDGGVSVGDVVGFVKDENLMAFDEPYAELIDTYRKTTGPVLDQSTENATLRFMQSDATELWGYRRYIERLSPFATQQGIKGAEFDKVIIVVDDEEAKTNNTFSYGKYFGVSELSRTDEENIANEKDSVVDRTRRLFYVCCSRALSDLVVVIFSEDTKEMREAVRAKGFFEPECIHVFD